MNGFGGLAAPWAGALTVLATALVVACSTRTTEPEHAETPTQAKTDECDCAPRTRLASCSSLKGVLPADEVLKRGKKFAGKAVSMRGTVIRDFQYDDAAGEDAPRCDRDANLHVLAFKIGDHKFAKKVARSENSTLEHVPMCEYAILIDPEAFACKPEGCCPVEIQQEVIASGRLARHECGYRLEEPTLCATGDDD